MDKNLASNFISTSWLWIDFCHFEIWACNRGHKFVDGLRKLIKPQQRNITISWITPGFENLTDDLTVPEVSRLLLPGPRLILKRSSKNIYLSTIHFTNLRWKPNDFFMSRMLGWKMSTNHKWTSFSLLWLLVVLWSKSVLSSNKCEAEAVINAHG